MSGHIIAIHPDGTKIDTAWPRKGPPDLKTLQAQVGGYIEHVKVRYEGKVRTAYVDEEGIIKCLPLNWRAVEELRVVFYGPLVIWIPDPARPVIKP